MVAVATQNLFGLMDTQKQEVLEFINVCVAIALEQKT